MVKVHSFDFAESVVYRHPKPMRHTATSRTDVILRWLKPNFDHQSLFAVDFFCAASVGSQPQLPVASGDLSDWSASPVSNTCQWIQLFQYGRVAMITNNSQSSLSTQCVKLVDLHIVSIRANYSRRCVEVALPRGNAPAASGCYILPRTVPGEQLASLHIVCQESAF